MASQQVIGKLITEIIARSNKYTEAFKKADQSNKTQKKQQRQLARSTHVVNAAYKKLLSTLTAVAGVQGFVGAAKGALQYAVNVRKLQGRLGLAIKQTQSWLNLTRFLFIEQNKAALGMQRFIRRVGEAQLGTGELLPVLERFNVALFDSEGRARDVWEVLGDLADIIQASEQKQKRLTIAFKAFDSEGADLIRTLLQGREGLNKFAEEGDKAFGQLTESTIKNLMIIQRRIDAFRQRITIGFGRILGGGPEMEIQFKKLFTELGRLVGKLGVKLMNTLLKVVGALEVPFTTIMINIGQRLVATIKLGFETLKLEAIVFINKVVEKFNQIFRTDIAGLDTSTEAHRKAQAEFNKAPQIFDNILINIADKFTEIDKLTGGFATGIDMAADKMQEKLNARLASFDKAAAPTGEPLPDVLTRPSLPRDFDKISQRSILQSLRSSLPEGSPISFRAQAGGGFQRFVGGRRAGELTREQAFAAVTRRRLDIQRRKDSDNTQKMTDHLAEIREIMDTLRAELQQGEGASSGGEE